MSSSHKIYCYHSSYDSSESDSDAKQILSKNLNTNIHDLRIKKTNLGDDIGLGLFTFNAIKKGEFIIEYKGLKLNHQQYKNRLKNILKNNDNSNLFKLDKNLYIDGQNMAKYINHSCKPNCRTKKMDINGEKRLLIFAIKNIKEDKNKGVELFFDYGDNFFDKEFPCKCYESNCKYSFKDDKQINMKKVDNFNKYFDCNLDNLNHNQQTQKIEESFSSLSLDEQMTKLSIDRSNDERRTRFE